MSSMRLILQAFILYIPHFPVWYTLIKNLSVIDFKLIKTECKCVSYIYKYI